MNPIFDYYHYNGVMKMTLKEKIQKLIELGFTYGQLGKICGCHSSSIASWMRGASNISNRLEENIDNRLKSFIKTLEELWE